MKKILSSLVLALTVVCLSSNVYASESTTITQDDYQEVIQSQETEVNVDKGSSFTVEVPVLCKIYSDWDKYKYYRYELDTIIGVKGDISSNEAIVIKHDTEVIMSAEGGLKDDILWRASSPAGYLLQNTKFDSKALSDQYTDYIWVNIHPDRNTSAGLWRGFMHVTVSVEDAGIVLNEEQFKEYVEDDTTIEVLTIPSTIIVDGKEMPIDGIGPGVLDDFINITDVYLETDKLFQMNGCFSARSLNKRTITIHGNDNVVEMTGVSDVDGLILYDNVKISAVTLPTDYITDPNNIYIITGYEEYVKDTVDEDMIVYKNGEMYGYWDTYIMNPDTIYCSFGSDFNCTEINKVIIPELTYPDYMASMFYGTTIKEAECYNYFVGNSWFKYCNDLTKVTLYDGVEYIGAEAFASCPNLTEIIIPESVKYIDNTAFDGTPFLENLKKGVENVYINGIWICYGDLHVAGETLVFPKELNTLTQNIIGDTVKNLSFEPGGETLYPSSQITSVTTLDVTGRSVSSLNYSFPNIQKLIIGGKTTYLPSFESRTSIREIELVDGLKGIADYGLNHCTGYNGTSLYIPATVNQIGGYSTVYTSSTGKAGSGWSNHVFYDFGKDGIFKEFIVDEDSEYYTTINGVLYTKDLQALVAIPRAAEFDNGVFTLPNEVRRLGELSFSRNKNITELVISDNLEIFNDETELENYYREVYTDYVNCLNVGNSLSLATYQYTNISKYTTRETNPNYISVDGILYTKDLKELVAVPNHYQGDIIIPEGCEKIRKNAFWLDSSGGNVHSGVKSISIPSTMKDIDSAQFNYIKSKWGGITKIARGNTNYTKYSNTILAVSSIDNIKYTNGTGTFWFNSSSGVIGRDPAPAWAAYEPFYLPEGTYIFSFDNPSPQKTVRYNAVLGYSDGYSLSLNTNTTKINYTVEDTVVTVGEGGVIVHFNGIFVDTTNNNAAVYNQMTSEIANEIIGLLSIHKHNYVLSEEVEATCSNDGYVRYACSCGDSYDETFESIEHDFVDGSCIVCYNTDIWHETAEAGVYDKYGKLAYSWDDLIANGGVTLSANGKNISKVNTSLTGSIVIPEGITGVDANAFKLCTEIINVKVPESAMFIATDAFRDCKSLKQIYMPDTLSLWNQVFIGCTSLESVEIPESNTGVGYNLFAGCTSLKTVSIPEGVTQINYSAFSGCTSLESIELPSSLTSIKYNAFDNCSSLEEIVIPNGVTAIDNYTFKGCDNLKNIVLSDNTTSIGTSAFIYCDNIESIIIPANVTEIKADAFTGCKNLKAVYFEGETLPTINGAAFNKTEGVVTTFYFKNSEAADAFTTDYYNSQYGQKSDDYGW